MSLVRFHDGAGGDGYSSLMQHDDRYTCSLIQRGFTGIRDIFSKASLVLFGLALAVYFVAYDSNVCQFI